MSSPTTGIFQSTNGAASRESVVQMNLVRIRVRLRGRGGVRVRCRLGWG